MRSLVRIALIEWSWWKWLHFQWIDLFVFFSLIMVAVSGDFNWFGCCSPSSFQSIASNLNVLTIFNPSVIPSSASSLPTKLFSRTFDTVRRTAWILSSRANTSVPHRSSLGGCHCHGSNLPDPISSILRSNRQHVVDSVFDKAHFSYWAPAERYGVKAVE